MSLYNTIFGVCKFNNYLLAMLDVKKYEDIPRFRDCYLNDKGHIVIFTRTGGGNRKAYEKDGEDQKEFNPNGPFNDDLRKLPGYIDDKDNDFDSTYAEFYYQPKEEYSEVIEKLTELGAVGNPTERWQQLFSDMKKENPSSPEAKRAIEEGKRLIEKIKEAENSGENISIIET